MIRKPSLLRHVYVHAGMFATVAVLTILLAVALPRIGIGANDLRPAAEGAAVSPVLTYQGRLLNPTTGAPQPDGVYTFVFRVYNVESGGTALWTETKDLPVANGLFVTLLGDTTAFSANLFDGQNLWLGIKVGSDPEATPRQRLAPVAYAMYSDNADRLDGQDGAFYRSASNINAGTLADARIPAAIARDAEVFSLVTAADGSGTGLDADLLDGKDSADFAAVSHNHDSRYYTEGESDGRFVNATGDSMSGASTDPILAVMQTGTGTAVRGNTASTAGHAAGVHGTAGEVGFTLSVQSGLLGESDTGLGVAGISKDRYAVYGHSINSAGVFAYSENSDAIHAAGTIRADKVVYNSPRTHYYSISGDTFKPRYINSGTNLISGGSTAGTYFSTTSTGGGGDHLFAPVHLPHGATITGMTFYYHDTSTLDLSSTFFRHTTTGNYTAISTISSSGIAGNGSIATALNTPVDNSNTFYEVYIRPSSGNWSTAGAGLRLIGVTFSYTLSEAP
jgi:hypothetical protein